MVHDNYSPEESLERIKLMMNYDLSKTLNENKIVSEQDNSQYFLTVAKSIMDKPEQVGKINFGNSSVNIDKACNAIKKAIEGPGTDKEGISYVTDNAFKDIANTIAIIRKYPSIAGNSLYDDLEGEMFLGSTKNKMYAKVAQQIGTWCQSNLTQKICIPKSAEELKYGSY